MKGTFRFHDSEKIMVPQRAIQLADEEGDLLWVDVPEGTLARWRDAYRVYWGVYREMQSEIESRRKED